MERGMTSSSEKQTLSFLIQRFRQAGIVPRTDLGQNFLIDMNLQRVLLETAQLGPDDVVLEVGTGTGGLTAQMAPLAAAVVSVEVDRNLHQLAGEELFQFPNVTLLHTDVLETKSRLRAAVVAAVERELQSGPSRRWKLVANLPYNVATPLISNLLALDRPPSTMTVTVQKEVADRIVARPGVKDYGALAIWVQSQCRAEIVRVLPPSVFWPRPKVSSAFLQMTLDETLRGRVPDRAFFHQFVRSMFCHRRKVLRSELLSAKGVQQGPSRRLAGRPGARAHAAGRAAGAGGNAPPLRGRPRRNFVERNSFRSCRPEQAERSSGASLNGIYSVQRTKVRSTCQTAGTALRWFRLRLRLPENSAAHAPAGRLTSGPLCIKMKADFHKEGGTMHFIEMSGKTLKRIVSEDELQTIELGQLGVTDDSLVRINRQGDIEIRRQDAWDVIGGLLGDFDHRVRRETGFDWVDCCGCGQEDDALTR